MTPTTPSNPPFKQGPAPAEPKPGDYAKPADAKKGSDPKEGDTKASAAASDPHESAIHFLLRHVMHTGDGVAARQAQQHLEAIHEVNPPADTESYDHKMKKAAEKGADDAAALAAAKKEKDEEDLAKAQDKEKAAKDKHRQDLEAASAKK